MKCSQAKLLISWAMDEPLPEYEGARLETHLQACNPCATYRGQLQRGRELFARAMAAPSENFEWKVQLKIQQALREAAARGLPVRERTRFWLPASLTAATTALAVVAIGGLVLLGSDPARQFIARGPVAPSSEPGPLASVQSDPPALEQSGDLRPVSATPALGTSAGSRAANSGSRSPSATTRAVRSQQESEVPSLDLRSLQQQVGLGTGLVPQDESTLPSAPGRLHVWALPRNLAERDLIERQLLEAQHRADELRRLLDDFEVGGTAVVLDSTATDSIPAAASPRR